MCLIIHSATGQMPEWDDFEYAAYTNPDGVGVMSERGVFRWLDEASPDNHRDQAWAHMLELSKDGVPFAVHLRWNTHGENSLANTHPFELPYGSYLMHNGVLGATSAAASGKKAIKSDTALYCERYLSSVQDWEQVKPIIEDHIGYGNKFCIMTERCEFILMNEDAGFWDGSLWFSNSYSLPGSVSSFGNSYGTIGGASVKYLPRDYRPSTKAQRGHRIYAGLGGELVSFEDADEDRINAIDDEEYYNNWLRERAASSVPNDAVRLEDLPVYEQDEMQDWIDMLPDEVYDDLCADYGYDWGLWPVSVVYDYLNEYEEDRAIAVKAEAS